MMKLSHARRLAIAGLFSIFMLAFCGKSYGIVCNGFGLSTQGPISFGNSGGSGRFTVNTGSSDGLTFCTFSFGTISGLVSSESTTLSSTPGNVFVDFSVSPNPDLAPRTGIITVVSQDGTALTVAVNQDAASGNFSLSAQSSLNRSEEH